eukprot:11815533-Ditylum_brightwellii.AAC.1
MMVEQFSHNVSKWMFTFQHYHHIPEMAPMVSDKDLYQRNHPSNAEMRINIGSNLTQQAWMPAFSLYS